MATRAELSSRIQRLINARLYRFSSHAERERHADLITIAEFEQSAERCEVIEDYPTDPRGASCHILGYTASGNPLHIVCGLSIPEAVIVITIYRPDPTEWLADWKTRR